MSGLAPEFAGQFAGFMSASPQNQGMQALVGQLNSVLSAELGKSITLTSPLSSGFVPFDLVAPSSLIYPVYSPLRNKLPRTPGQGTIRRRKVITGISGSQTGPSGGAFVRLGIPELVQSGGSISGQSSAVNWPLNLPGTGSQDSVDLTVPYRFWGLSENLSWLAQFAGQGFEDISALANLLLLQEFMLNEEASHLNASSIALSTPSAPTLTARAANSGETALTGVTTNVYVKIAANTFFGSTAAGSGTSVAWSSGQVVDVQIALGRRRHVLHHLRHDRRVRRHVLPDGHERRRPVLHPPGSPRRLREHRPVIRQRHLLRQRRRGPAVGAVWPRRDRWLGRLPVQLAGWVLQRGQRATP